MRSTLTRSSIKAAIHSPLDHRISFPCSRVGLFQVKWGHGVMPRRMKISPKVKLYEQKPPTEIHFASSIDATSLDIWVLDQLRTLLHNASTDAILDSQLRNDKVIIFLHLLGLDTTGHSYRPHSKVGSSAFCMYCLFQPNRHPHRNTWLISKSSTT